MSLRASVVRGRKVGHDDADVLLLAGRRQQVREGAGGDVGDRAIANLLRVEVVEVRRHLVEQDQDWIVALEELEPVLLVRRLGTAGPERLELIALAELVGDLAPEEVIRVVPAVERRDIGRVEGRRVRHPAQ